jgi:hypothetical protein
MSNDVSMKWQYGPPFFYAGLYEEESKAFKIVGGVHRDALWLKLKDDFRQDRLDRGAFGAQLSVMYRVQLRASMRGDGSGALA